MIYSIKRIYRNDPAPLASTKTNLGYECWYSRFTSSRFVGDFAMAFRYRDINLAYGDHCFTSTGDWYEVVEEQP